MSADYQTIERLAMRLCMEAGSHWHHAGCKRNHWRRKAAREIDRARSIASADAFFGVFGMRRVK